MATVTGLTAASMLALANDNIVDADLVGDDLVLQKRGGALLNVGSVRGAPGPTGPAGTSVPAGGAAGQILQKVDGADYNFMWSTFLRPLAATGQLGTTYSLQLSDAETMVTLNNTSPITVTIPTNAAVPFPSGTRIRLLQANTGAVTIVAAGGVFLIYPAPYTPVMRGWGATIELIQYFPNFWVIDGLGALRTTDLGWQAWTPDINATSAGPNLGTGPIRKGYYCVDSDKRVIGGATVRWGSGGGMGSGTYRFTLPVQGVNRDDSGYSPIGNGSIGIGTVHSAAMLHFNGVTPSTTSAVMAVQGGLFVADAVPAGTKQNAHWHFAYQAA